MARSESVACGGFFKTPQHLVPMIAEVLGAADSHNNISAVDPCAGEGEAVIGLCELIPARTCIYTCELELSRHTALKTNLKAAHEHESATLALHGDAFQVDFIGCEASLLYLNPPYDTDPVHGRLEERFLSRFSGALRDDGVLVFVVPFYALAASARTLATEYAELSCFRFPEADFAAYRQVVLFARKIESLDAPDPTVLQQVETWSASVDGLQPLDQAGCVYYLPETGYRANSQWRMRELDLVGLLARSRPWSTSTRASGYLAVPHILPDVPVEDLMFRSFPVATLPRPAHIAGAIASGLFNGRRVSPMTAGLPDLLVKGVFAREYVTIDEKYNKEGDLTGLVQVQQPKLVTTVLDLSSRKYSTLKIGGKSGSLSVAEMTIEDLLEHYGPGLMTIMAEQCPVTYDGRRDAGSVPLAPVARDLYTAQAHAARAIVKLLGGSRESRRARKGKSAILLGEIGSGKTSVALTVGQTIARRVLVMCPPHLLDSWRDETKAVLPDAEFLVLETVTDVDALADLPADKFIVAVVSRETAKLGHGWEAVRGACPKCGATLPEGDLAKKRTRCESSARTPGDSLARAAGELALRLAIHLPKAPRVAQALQGRFIESWLTRRDAIEPRPSWAGCAADWVDAIIPSAVALLSVTPDGKDECRHQKLVARLLLAHYSPERIARVIRSLKDDGAWHTSVFARSLLLLLEPDSAIQASLRDAPVFTSNNYWNYFPREVAETLGSGCSTHFGKVRWADGKLTLDEHAPASLELSLSLLSSLGSSGKFAQGEVCGEPLFQAIPEPRRYPLSRYIAKRHADLFDLLILDEGHEYGGDASAQERAAHRLTALSVPTILMSGSIMNGYAESLFSNMWALSPTFREEFARDERQPFIDRYGYRKRLLTERERENGDVVAFGSHTDRVERSGRIIGEAPGLLPLFLFRHLLKISVTLHKADLAVDIPPLEQFTHEVQADPELMASYKSLQKALIARIRADQFDPERAGKLFGALAELPSYLDRASNDTGNHDDGTFAIRYPESLKSEIVAVGQSFPASRLSAKEEWLIDTLRTELTEGRNVMVLSWHVSLLPRLARIIKAELGEEAPVLYADKVAAWKRQDWINGQIVAKGRRIMIANPLCIQTGLNNLVHFATEVWFESPACNPIVFRQAIGRIDRIGQKRPTRVHVPVFAGTLQVQLHDLLLRKVAVSISTDGLDNESCLLAAGAADSGYLAGLSIGKQLWQMLNAS